MATKSVTRTYKGVKYDLFYEASPQSGYGWWKTWAYGLGPLGSSVPDWMVDDPRKAAIDLAEKKIRETKNMAAQQRGFIEARVGRSGPVEAAAAKRHGGRASGRRATKRRAAQSYRIQPYLSGRGPTATVFVYPTGEVEVWKTEDHARTRVFHSTGYRPGGGGRKSLRRQAADVIGFAVAYSERPKEFDRESHELEQVYKTWWRKHGEAFESTAEGRGD